MEISAVPRRGPEPCGQPCIQHHCPAPAARAAAPRAGLTQSPSWRGALHPKALVLRGSQRKGSAGKMHPLSLGIPECLSICEPLQEAGAEPRGPGVEPGQQPRSSPPAPHATPRPVMCGGMLSCLLGAPGNSGGPPAGPDDTGRDRGLQS